MSASEASTFTRIIQKSVSLQKEWRALPKEERDNYTKSEAAKGVVERVSYAKVWGERAKDKSQYLSQLHTDYYNKVGRKYGWQEVSPMMNFQRKRNEDASIRTR